MKGILRDTLIYAIAQEVTKCLVDKYYKSITLPETSLQQSERVMEELQPRGPDDESLNSKLNALEKWRTS